MTDDETARMFMEWRDRARQAEAAIERVRKFVEGMRTWCSPHGVAGDYANRILEVLDQPKEG